MPSSSVLLTALRELTTRERSHRVNEPDLVMDDPEKVADFTRAGEVDGVMAPVYLYHCAQICEVVRAGDTVLDLGCGPANQLAMVAQLNPETNFIGLDLSPVMLERAQNHIGELGLSNVELRKADITDLSFLGDNSIDAVMSTVVLHHLPDIDALEKTFIEISRILKPGGGLYLVDFGHLKSEKSIDYFAYQYADRQPELFTLDYLYSLRAAFHPNDFKKLARKHLNGRARFHSTAFLPFMVAIKSSPRFDNDSRTREKLAELKSRLPSYHKTDLSDLRTLFRIGGLKSTLLD